METDRRPDAAQKLYDGPAPTPRPAATVIVVRGGADTLEVLLVQRHPDQRFLGGHWVFPGGAVDEEDLAAGETSDAAHRLAAVRELREEAAIEGLGPSDIARFSRWITPRGVKIRFDTHFYIAPTPEGAEPRVDGAECVDLRWLTPAAAIEAYRAGDLPVILPTLKHLEQLARFDSADALVAAARDREVEPVEPHIVKRGGTPTIVLPGEDGYDDAEEAT